MSATTFAGSAQFAVASILGAGGGIVSAIVAATLLNARYAPISVSIAPVFVGGPVRRLLESQLIVDESWAMSRRPDGRYDRRLLVGGGPRPLRVLGRRHRRRRARGRCPRRPGQPRPRRRLPRALPRPARAAGADRRALAAAVLGGTIALALLPVAPAGVPIVAAAAACLHRLETTVSDVWIVVVAVGAATVALKSVGPVLLGGRPLPGAPHRRGRAARARAPGRARRHAGGRRGRGDRPRRPPRRPGGRSRRDPPARAAPRVVVAAAAADGDRAASVNTPAARL